jgi:hypothetical protein
MHLDPTFAMTLRAALLLLFAAALTHKMRRFTEFEGTLASYFRGFGVSGTGLLRPAAVLAIAFESFVVGACLWSRSGTPAAISAGGVLLLYALAMAINLHRGNVLLDCGCSWGSGRQPVRYALVVRNVVLAALALTLALPVSGRPLAAIDVASIGAAVLTAALLYSAANRLLMTATPTRRMTQ